MEDWTSPTMTSKTRSYWPNEFTKATGITYPIIGGPMYPCSNPELVAAVSEAGGIGVIQPLSLTFVHGYGYREGLKYIRSLTSKPVGLNALIEASSKTYLDRMRGYVEVALEEGVRFFVTSLGNPKWVVEKAHAVGGIVYHDVTERKWAVKALDAGVDGFICVNRRAGGHAGEREPEVLLQELGDLKIPLVCAGGIGSQEDFLHALELGYKAVQLGTRFLASRECKISEEYKSAIVKATAHDIILTERLTGVPLAVIDTPGIRSLGTRANPLVRWLLRHPKGKKWMRTYYMVRSGIRFRTSVRKPNPYKDIWQAGKSVESIDSIQSVAEIVKGFVS
jgi:nitronate monooxygenase